MNSPTFNPDNLETRKKAIGLFTYIYELAGLRSRMIRSVERYKEVIWLWNLFDLPGCYGVALTQPGEDQEQEDEGDIWIEVQKPKISSPPAHSEELQGWLDPDQIADPFVEQPTLIERDSTEIDSQSKVVASLERQLADEPDTIGEGEEPPQEIVDLLGDYIQNQWLPWALQERPQRQAQEVYEKLFSIHQRQQRLGELYEVIVGFGLLSWRISEAERVQRHLITAQVGIDFDLTRGIITVAPGAEGATPTLEQDMLEPNRRPESEIQKQLERQAEILTNNMWRTSSVKKLLRAYANALRADARYEDSTEPISRIPTEPLVQFAPALILRKRGERTFQHAFRSIKESLEDGVDIPAGIELLLQIEGPTPLIEEVPKIESESSFILGDDSEILFPLPANEEQREIVERLSRQRGVVVQGPPGTGKSHTIANIICHLLASGKKVLVTSHTSRALRVLREKIPPEVASLCVSLLGNDRESLQALEDSVNGITRRHNSWSARKNQNRIDDAKKRLGDARRDEAVILSDLRAIREREIYRHPRMFGDYEGTAKEIAIVLRDREPNYSWIGIKPDAHDTPPLTSIEAIELLELTRAISTDHIDQLAMACVSFEDLLTPRRFSELVTREKTLKHAFASLSDARNVAGYRLLLSASADQRESLANSLLSLREHYGAVASSVFPWTEIAAAEILSGQGRHWNVILEKTTGYLEDAQPLLRQVEGLKVSGIQERDRNTARHDARILLSHIREGGKLRRFIFTPKVVRERDYLIKDARVNGRPANNEQRLKALIAYLDLGIILDNLRSVWGELAPARDTSFERQAAEFEDLRSALVMAFELQDVANSIRNLTRKLEGFPEPILHDMQQVKTLERSVRAATIEVLIKEVLSSLNSVIAKIQKVAQEVDSHPAMMATRDAIVNRDLEEYAKVHSQLAELQKVRGKSKRQNLLLDKLRSILPEIADSLLENFSDEVWEDRFTQFEETWNWAKADRWLTEITDPNAETDLARRLDDARERQSVAILKITEAEAWNHCLETLKDSERQHLVAWTKAIKRVGKGYGKYAPEHRRAAQEHMMEARGAIPAWIMPLNRVAESVQPESESYDVVIIDEASQSGPEAILLHFLAPKIIVVGDDNQISPDFVGINRANVIELRHRHIENIPHRDALGLDNSFFDLAEIRFGGRIRLREHFRCVPEIIQFSNNLAYRHDPLIPLRQFGSDRLLPAVEAIYIQDGYQSGRVGRRVNPPEAEAVALSIADCIGNPDYDGKSMGVISLIGGQQAKLIERNLLDTIGPDEMERRALVCGDAYAFQGDERDVIFLSMVSAPGEGTTIRALTRPSDLRRFNVAASRARDQMRLFHSATLNDLNPMDLRHELLAYCKNPSVEPIPYGDVDIGKFHTRSRRANRQLEDAPEPFDSWFEVDVFLKVTEQGFRVIPQYEVLGRRIDLVVEGMNGRMAVECDGDTWHGPEQFDADMARQRQLERSNWVFWRVLASVFYRDPDGAMESLWEKLDDLGIGPNARETEPSPADTKDEELIPVISEIANETQDSSTIAESSEPTDSARFGEDFSPRTQIPLTTTENQPIAPTQYSLEQSSNPTESNSAHLVDDAAAPTLDDHEHLIPYETWAPRPLPDPRETPPKETRVGLQDIVEAEGPVIATRAYRIYVKAAGIHSVGRQIRKRLNQAVYSAIRDGLILEVQEDSNRRLDLRVLRISGKPAVLLRSRGDRSIHEIPYSEIGRLMVKLQSESARISKEELFRLILDQYQLSRMTGGTRERLEIAYERFT